MDYMPLSGPSFSHSTSAGANILKVPHSRVQATSNQSLSSDPGIPRLGYLGTIALSKGIA